MKITLLKTHFLSALNRVNKIISVRPQLPILQHVLLKADAGVSLAATNTETFIMVRTNAKVEKEGGCCVSAKIFTELITSLPDGPINLQLKEGVLLIKSNGYEASVPVLSESEFPPIPKKQTEKEKENVSKKFLPAVESVLFAAATDEGRPILTGVKIKKQEKGTLLVATDGYRLALQEVPLSFLGTEDVILPARTLVEVVRIGQESEEKNVSVSFFDTTQTRFVIGETEIYTRVLDGEYPNFEKIIPKKHTTRATASKEQLLQAVKSTSIFARDNANIIKMHIADNFMILSANTPQVGQNTVTIEADVEGEEADIAFNSRFVLDFLNHTEGEDIVFEMTGSLNPGVFKVKGDNGLLHIIMPVRVNT